LVTTGAICLTCPVYEWGSTSPLLGHVASEPGAVAAVRVELPLGMLAYMQRTTVKLPDDLDARLRHEAARRGTTISEVTRQAIEEHLGGRRTRRRLLAAGAGGSGRQDISERIEEILTSEGLASD
jgi:plasmid stability protein